MFDKDDLEILIRTAKRRRNKLALSPRACTVNNVKPIAGQKMPPLTPVKHKSDEPVVSKGQPIFDIEK